MTSPSPSEPGQEAKLAPPSAPAGWSKRRKSPHTAWPGRATPFFSFVGGACIEANLGQW